MIIERNIYARLVTRTTNSRIACQFSKQYNFLKWAWFYFIFCCYYFLAFVSEVDV